MALLLALGGCVRGAGDPAPASPEPGRAMGSLAPVRRSGGHDLVKNATFDGGTSLPWMMSVTAPGAASTFGESGELCIEAGNTGKNAWDVQVRHREMVIQKGHSYTLSFKARASRKTRMRPKVGMAGEPYTEYWSSTIDVGETPAVYRGRFTMGAPDDATAEFAFHLGGSLAAAVPLTVCIDDVHLEDPEFSAPVEVLQEPIPDVRVNQVGYLPHLPKRATLRHAAREPVSWELVDAKGMAVARGKTTVFGDDPDAGEHLHVLDFSSFDTVGRGYVLRALDAKSFPFDVRPDVYTALKYDALAYFYVSRSGVPIEMPYARGKQWTHPAGHPGDRNVPCGKDIGCNYSLDVSGGWYDAGDYGKYVVNGGIAAWTLLDQFERARAAGAGAADFGDGKLNVPERSNGVPDLLDEARFEIEFLLRMQVPAGRPKAGMVHHKVHDVDWSPIGQAPNETTLARHLRPPSTAATLNLAAVGAQCARVWKTLDAAFSKRCLTAAETAWAAARANPAVYAPEADKKGGGPYDDTDVRDEFYWAAAELFVTTGKPEYRAVVTGSPFFKRFPTKAPGSATSGAVTPLTWQDTAALGSVSLAVVPNTLDKTEVDALRAQIVAAGDHFLGLADKTGHGVPLGAGPGHRYPWGSNSLVLNNALVLGLAHDFSGNAKYLRGVVDAMDYVLGRNPLAKSYVSGYGKDPLAHPHHRFWANQAGGKYPGPPPGALAGGPNSELQDPYARAAVPKGAAAQKCYVDHIEAYSVNEVAINWNAPLAWVTAYLDEAAGKKRP